jgi:hypothetical protein
MFFFFMFVGCNFLASIADGGGGVAATKLNGAVSSAAIIWTVDDTDDFLTADVAHPAYLVCGNEIVTYTGKTATTFTGITRAAADPEIVTSTVAAVHADNTQVKTLAVSAMDTFMNMNVTTSNAPFGAYDALTFVGRLFTHLPKFIAWNYSFLNTGQVVMLKYFLLYPISAGFVFTLAFGFISLAMGLFKL